MSKKYRYYYSEGSQAVGGQQGHKDQQGEPPDRDKLDHRGQTQEKQAGIQRRLPPVQGPSILKPRHSQGP